MERQAACAEKGVPRDRETTAPENRQRLKGWRVEDAISGQGSAAAPGPPIRGDNLHCFGAHPTA